MTPRRSDVLKYPEMLDSILKNLVTMTIQENPSSSTPSTPPINWLALSNAIPETNPEMCKRRYMELRNLRLIEREQAEFGAEDMVHSGRDNRPGDPLYDYVKMLFHRDEKERRKQDKMKRKNEMKEKQKAESDDTAYTDSETRSTTPPSFPAASTGHSSKSQGGPSMVIHVCDEAKSLRQDFTCPRDLLIREMRYFAEYLSVDSQRLEEVDISVHCDIHIFDWLMKYVKRDSGLLQTDEQPKLEPNNVISILISSDFLKMDSLVEDCIAYCHENLSLIVSTPCNMNCVNDRLTDRIAQRFNHNELEDVKDRKDKFKSKLFCRKIEKLFNNATENPDSPGNAASLFKCKYCGKVVTEEQKSKMPCTNTQMCIDGRGLLSYEHKADLQWDVSNFILSLHEELKKWGLVYWRLWGVINHLVCSRCEQTFQLCDFGHCQYHPEKPQFRQLVDMQVTDNLIGTYPCCNQRVLRFDPTGMSKGCRFKDHVVIGNGKKQKKLLDDLHTFKSLVAIDNKVVTASSDLNIFSAEEICCGVLEPTSTPVEITSAAPPQPQPKLSSVSLKVQRTVSPSDQYYTGLVDNSEEDTGEEEVPKRKFVSQNSSSHMSTISKSSLSDATVKTQQPFSAALVPSAGPTKGTASVKKGKSKSPQTMDSTPYSQFPAKQKWDSARSVRWNQDAQREEDMKRIQDMTVQLTKQRSDKSDKTKNKDARDYPGGIFSKLEANFYANIRSNTGANSGRQQGGNSNRDSRIRGRPTQDYTRKTVHRGKNNNEPEGVTIRSQTSLHKLSEKGYSVKCTMNLPVEDYASLLSTAEDKDSTEVFIRDYLRYETNLSW